MIRMTAEKIEEALGIDPKVVKKELTSFISNKVKEAGAKGVVVGLSGGLDSSTVAFLCVKAIGARRVIGLIMPEENLTNPEDVEDALSLAKKLDIEYRIINIKPIFESLRASIKDFKDEAVLPAANLRPRIRMTILYYYANLLNYLVVGSGNRSEIRAGYFTKHGDGGADLFPIGCLYKTQVKRLAEHLGVPKKIIEKTPSAGLWAGQTDEAELGISYEKLDRIYAGLDLNLSMKDIAKAVGVKESEVKRFIERENRTAHKLKIGEIPRVSLRGS